MEYKITKGDIYLDDSINYTINQRLTMRTSNQFYENNPTLLDGEIAIVKSEDNSKVIEVKIGDGSTDFRNLPTTIIIKEQLDEILDLSENNIKESNHKELKKLENKLQYDFGNEVTRLDDKILNQNKYIEKVKNDLKNLSITLYAESAMLVGILVYILCN